MPCFPIASAEEDNPLDKSKCSDALEDESQPLIQEKESDSQLRKNITGYASISIGILLLATGIAFTQALDQSIPHSELNLLRFAVQLVVSLVGVLLVKKCNFRVERSSIPWLIFGGFLYTPGSYFYYGAVYYLPVGEALALTNTLVVLITSLIGCFKRRGAQWYEVIAVILCLSGVYMITQPMHITRNLRSFNLRSSFHSPCGIHAQFNLSIPNKNDSLSYTDDDQGLNRSDAIYKILQSPQPNDIKTEAKQRIIGYILCVLNSLISVALITTLRYKLESVSVYVFSFWASAMGVPLSLVLMFIMETPVFPTMTICRLFLFGHMIIAGTGIFFLAKAYQVLRPEVNGLLRTSEIILNFIFQYTFLANIHPGNTNYLAIIGVIILFFGNALVPATELYTSRQSRTELGNSSH